MRKNVWRAVVDRGAFHYLHFLFHISDGEFERCMGARRGWLGNSRSCFPTCHLPIGADRALIGYLCSSLRKKF